MDGLRIVREQTTIYEQKEIACIRRYRVGFCQSARNVDAPAIELDAVVSENRMSNTVLVPPDRIDLFVDDQENGSAQVCLVLFKPVTSLSS